MLTEPMKYSLPVLLSIAISGCATNSPLRDARIAWDGSTVAARSSQCTRAYAATDKLIWDELGNISTSVATREALNTNVNRIVAPQLKSADTEVSRCWKSSYENHQDLTPIPGPEAASTLPPPGYDLLLAEFDDQGERTDVASGQVAFKQSEVNLIESRLEGLLAEELARNPDGGLNLVVFTHGWHGSASATDSYSIWFKAILQEITSLEQTSRRSICESNRRALQATSDSSQRSELRDKLASYACPQTNAAGQGSFARRRTVGIEVAWRGDSETIPWLTWANFWDRKGAAQTMATGGVHDLFARLHKFYIAHSCHSPGATQSPGGNSCDAVHLLALGHSFGALIDYHVLNDDLAAGVLGDHSGRAYGFGDLTVFLNPAFEGEREVTLMDAGLNHDPYPGQSAGMDRAANTDLPGWPSKAQMPVLVTLQSKGDWATHYAFPFARFFTGFFENTPTAGERDRSLQASGWIEPYITHHLSSGVPDTKSTCDDTTGQPLWFCPFDLTHETPEPHPLVLRWQGSQNRPDYFPLWLVTVDKSIMSNHDDISNPVIIGFVAQLFRAAYEQSELIHEASRRREAESHPASPLHAP